MLLLPCSLRVIACLRRLPPRPLRANGRFHCHTRHARCMQDTAPVPSPPSSPVNASPTQDHAGRRQNGRNGCLYITAAVQQHSGIDVTAVFCAAVAPTPRYAVRAESSLPCLHAWRSSPTALRPCADCAPTVSPSPATDNGWRNGQPHQQQQKRSHLTAPSLDFWRSQARSGHPRIPIHPESIPI